MKGMVFPGTYHPSLLMASNMNLTYAADEGR